VGSTQQRLDQAERPAVAPHHERAVECPCDAGGLIVAEGRVLTNTHNLHGEEAEVVFPDGRSATGPLVGPDVRVARLEEGGTLQLRIVRGVEELEITVVATPDC
jgi:hypothetical protein